MPWLGYLPIGSDCKYLKIESGKTLIINGSDLQFTGTNQYIVLESGAKLILMNGAKISKGEESPPT